MTAGGKPPLFYGWVVVAICFVTVAVSFGIRYSFPVFYRSILDEFGWPRAETALIFSINTIVYGVTAPVVGLAVDRFGPGRFMAAGAALLAVATASLSLAGQVWHFYLIFGILVSLGASVTGNVPNTTLVSHWFIKRRGAALGFFNAGVSVAFLMASAVEYMIRLVGWRNSFVFLGLLAVGLVPVIANFQRLDPRDKDLAPDGESPGTAAQRTNTAGAKAPVPDAKWVTNEWKLRRVIATGRFWMLFTATFGIFGIAMNLVLAHQVVFVVDQGYSPAFGALVLSLYGVFYGLGNLLGFLSDRFGREVTATIGLTLAASGVLMLILNRGDQTPWLMYAYGLLFGLGLGIVSPSVSASIADIFQGKNFGLIVGLVSMGFGIGGSVSPWLGGKIFDMWGTYLPAFYLVMVWLAVAAISIWMAAPRHIRPVPGKARHNP
ncbi:MAG: MFS transporter [Chloroflexi bacterium]|nr:MFS transporter [Chloroflexota bacterium]